MNSSGNAFELSNVSSSIRLELRCALEGRAVDSEWPLATRLAEKDLRFVLLAVTSPARSVSCYSYHIYIALRNL